jgi:hypothetical protein
MGEKLEIEKKFKEGLLTLNQQCGQYSRP